MFKIEVKNSKGELTNSTKFNTKNEAEVWFNKSKVTGLFGKPGGWFHEWQLTQEQIDSALETSEVDNPFPNNGDDPDTFTLYRLVDAFSFSISDITIESNAKSRFERGKNRQEFGASIIAQVYGINEEKIAAGLFDNAKLQDLFSNTTLANIERFLFNGSISTAKVLIQSLDNTFYTNEEKSFILGLIDNYLKGV